jgi:hypothetical protein
VTVSAEAWSGFLAVSASSPGAGPRDNTS